uniref:Uncharacterized protein n=1 Tax=Nannospalax galili TaxID=1026970 RepID=A0A8C6R6V6_NANGA
SAHKNIVSDPEQSPSQAIFYTPTKWMDVFFPLEKPDTKQKSSKKKTVIPQIIITRASNEMLVSYGLPESEEQRTIREHADWGPYYRHRSPSTIAAYGLPSKE